MRVEEANEVGICSCFSAYFGDPFPSVFPRFWSGVEARILIMNFGLLLFVSFSVVIIGFFCICWFSQLPIFCVNLFITDIFLFFLKVISYISHFKNPYLFAVLQLNISNQFSQLFFANFTKNSITFNSLSFILDIFQEFILQFLGRKDS